MKRISLLMLFSVLLLTACNKSKSEGDASATLQFSQAARLFTLGDRLNLSRTTYAASTFKMKLIAAYLTEDIGEDQNNVGQTTMIYLNSQCNDDIMHCDIAGGTAEDGAPMSNVVTDFFDFSSDSAANTALNSQNRSIYSGTYKYARLEFCKYADGDDANIKWASTDAGVSSEQSFKRTQCTVNSAVFSPAVTIASGGTATITLTYDISASVSDGGSTTDPNCTSGGVCFDLPTFTPSAEAM